MKIIGTKIGSAILYGIMTAVDGIHIWDDFSVKRGHLRTRWVVG